MTTLQKWSWRIMTGLAVLVGLFSLRYVMNEISWAPLELQANMAAHPDTFVFHAIFASIALLIGPWQFVPSLRQRHPKLHRWMGRTYLLCCLVAGLCAYPIALGSYAGPVAAWGFSGLATAWLATGTFAYMAIRRRNITRHREWMIRSYALTLAAVTLRAYLPLPSLFGMDHTEGYAAISWVCWVPNLIIAEILIRREQISSYQRAAH